jgi:hypothetical protein
MSCNGVMAKTETVCYSCGTVNGDSAKAKKGNGFAKVSTVLFFGSVGLTLVSLFTGKGPPVMVCLCATLILLFVKSSADQLGKNRT